MNIRTRLERLERQRPPEYELTEADLAIIRRYATKEILEELGLKPLDDGNEHATTRP